MSRACRKCRSNLVAYMDKELSEKDAQRTAEHMTFCTACRNEFEQLHDVFQMLPTEALLKPSEDFDRVFWDKVSSIKSASRSKQYRKWISDVVDLCRARRMRFATSAVFAVLLCVITFFALKPRHEIPQKDLLIAKDIELFSNMDVIENSDALDDFEIINMIDVLEQGNKG
jgi:predicted anti-sigma-YlaC factor YlaD